MPALAAAMLAAPAALAEPLPELAVKAAYLYNFAVFSEWPDSDTGPLPVCISNEEPLFREAQYTINNKETKGRRIIVTPLAAGMNISDCRILFIGESDRARARPLLNQARNAPVLTVTDVDGLTAQGVMIGLFEKDNTLAFEVNQEASRRAGLMLSSKLLRLARRVF
jgi:hypothetical protein